MIRQIFLAGLTAWGMLASLAAQAAAVVRDITLTRAEQSPQVLLELSQETKYKLFTLSNPHRVVVDLQNTSLSPNVKVPKASGIVDAIRTGRQPDDTLRVVIELKSPLPADTVWLSSNGKGKQLLISLGDSAAATAAAEESLRVVRAAHAPKDTNRDIVIAVDAGHGGKDPGAIGRKGTREKDVVLAIARALANRINEEPGMRAVLTRDSDIFLKHRDRMARARAAKADMFVSIHADSIRNRDVSGASVYVLSEKGATDEAARWLAERENAADLIGGVSLAEQEESLASVLLDLSQAAAISSSMTAAESVLAALHRVGEVRKPKVQQAPFLVLKSPDIPSLLIETAYISNPDDERRLRSASHQKKLAEAIFIGVRNYFTEYPPPGTRFAKTRRSGGVPVIAAGPGTP